MASTVNPVTKVVVYRSDSPPVEITVDLGTDLQGLVFDRGMAEKCPAPHGKWPPPGVHGGQATLPIADTSAVTTDSVTTMDATAMDAPAPDPPPNCYIVNGELYCP